jgi:hypothetical protein
MKRRIVLIQGDIPVVESILQKMCFIEVRKSQKINKKGMPELKAEVYFA